jgi:hypothetical protein
MRISYYPTNRLDVIITAKEEGSSTDQSEQFKHALLSRESQLMGHLTTIPDGFSVNMPSAGLERRPTCHFHDGFLKCC